MKNRFNKYSRAKNEKIASLITKLIKIFLKALLNLTFISSILVSHK